MKPVLNYHAGRRRSSLITYATKRLFARIWLGVICVATVLAVSWLFYVLALPSVAVYDLDPEALERLSDSEVEGFVRTAELFLFSTAALVFLCLGWAVTAVVLLRRRNPAE